MKITVIIPTYNRASFLPKAIQSILVQNGSYDLDILVINDGSTDSTSDILTDLCLHHPQIRTIQQANAGISAARNTGLQNLLDETQIVTFLDSDDIMPQNRLAADMALLIGNPDLDLTYGRMMITNALDYNTGAPPKTARTIEVCAIHLSCVLMRRQVWERVGLFDEVFRLSEDTDFIFRIFESGFRFQQVETLCMYYLRHETNITNDTTEAQRHYARAILRSLQRRKADPNRKLIKPNFDLTPILEQGPI